jgi:hypothetical protein
MDEAHPLLESQLSDPLPGRGKEDLTDIDSHSADSVVTTPRAQHLSLAAAEVEMALTVFETAHVTQEPQLVLSERVEDSMLSLGDLVKAQDHACVCDGGEKSLVFSL